MFPIKTVQDYMYPQKLRGDLAEQAKRARLLEEQAQWYGPKSQAEIDLINQGQIPHYQAQNRLIDQGQIPHYMAQNRLLGEQEQEAGFGNKFKGLSWNEYKRLQDEYNALAGITDQQEQPSQSNYQTNMPILPLSEVQQRNIANSLNNSYNGTRGPINSNNQRQANNVPRLTEALNYSPAPQEQQGNQELQLTPEMDQIINQANAMVDRRLAGNPQNLSEANEQFQNAAQPVDKEKRMAEIRARQQEILGKVSGAKVGKVASETPEEKRAGTLEVERGKQDIKAYSKIMENAKVKANSSSNVIKHLKKLNELSGKLGDFESGPAFGKAIAISDVAQEYDKTVNTIIKDQMDATKGQGSMSEFKIRQIESTKPGRNMNPEARKNVAGMIGAMAKRTIEQKPFFALTEESGFTSKQAESLWDLYDKERPEFNSKTNTANENNLNTFDDYMNKDALYAAMHGKSYSPREQGEEPNNDMVMVVAQNGQKGMIPKGKLDEALKRGARVIQ